MKLLSNANAQAPLPTEVSEDADKDVVLVYEPWTISPERAAEMLLNNHTNRPFKPVAIADYSREIREGRWRRSHQSIAVTELGELVDGQNRLAAVVKTKITINVMVCVNAQKDTFDVIDRGRNRSASDLLYIKQVPNSTAISAIARSTLIGRTKSTPSIHKVAEFGKKHQETLAEFVPLMRRHRATLTGAFVRAKLANWNGVSDAAERLLTVSWLSDNDPMKVLFLRLDDRHNKAKGELYRYDLALAALLDVNKNRGTGRLKLVTADIELAWP